MLTRRDGWLPWIRTVLSVLALAGAGFLALANDLKPAPSITVIALVTGALVLVGGVLPGFDDFRFGRALRTERLITAELRAALSFLVEFGKFDALKLRLHFFEVRHIWTWRGWPISGKGWQWNGRPIAKALVRGGFFSIKSDEALSNVTWPEGVGLVGTVWQDRNGTGVAMNTSLPVMPTPEEWSHRPARDRHNMPWELAKRMRRIEAVFAVAVLATEFEGDVVAVLSADTIADDLPKFEIPEVKAFLRRTARGAWRARKTGHE